MAIDDRAAIAWEQHLIAEAVRPLFGTEDPATSLTMITVDTNEERRYLMNLRDRQQIDAAPAARLHDAVGMRAI